MQSEYETDEAFAKRQAAVAPRPDRPFIIGKAVDLEQVRFNAKKQALEISLYAVDNLSAPYDEVFGYGTPYEGKIKLGFHAIDVVIDEREVKTGAYVGTNAYGSRARVTKITRITNAIFKRAAADAEETLIRADPETHIFSTLPMGPVEAQKLKPGLSAAIVVYPEAPYFATGVKDWGGATLDMPEGTIQKINVIAGDIRCVLLLDGAKKVIAAYTAR